MVFILCKYVCKYHLYGGIYMFKKISFGLVSLGLTTQVMAAPLTMGQIYNYAKKGDLRTLRQISKHIDLVGKDGNTSLCRAVYNNDYKAFNVLKSVGANVKHPCAKRIPAEKIQAFNLGYTNWAKGINAQMALTSAPSAKAITTASSAETAATAGTIATETGLSTGAMVGIGVGAAVLVGGGIALAAGGGGGGGGNSNAPQKPEMISDVVGSGQVDITSSYSNASENKTESNITVKVGADVQAPSKVNIYGIKYDGTQGGTGVYNAYGTNDVSIVPKGNITIDNASSDIASIYGIYRPYMTTMDKSMNAYLNARGTINIQNKSDADIWGMSVGGWGSGAFGKGAVSEISIKNDGHGNIIGIEGLWHAVNNGRGTIQINNKGNGNVIGLYGLRNGCGGGNARISINNTGSGNITGLYGHFNSCKRGTGVVDILSQGGNLTTSIYGLKMGDNRFTAEAAVPPPAYYQLSNSYAAYASDGYQTTTPNGNASGTVRILQEGSYATIYGMYNDTEYGMFNTLADDNEGSELGETNVGADALISITQEKNGSGMTESLSPIYGMYSSDASAITANVWRKGTSYKGGFTLSGRINIDQKGNGNVYGVYSSGPFYNMYLKEELDISESDIPFGEDDGENIVYEALASINVKNRGDGTAIGVYGESDIDTLKYYDTNTSTERFLTSSITVSSTGRGDAVGIYKTGNGTLTHSKLTKDGEEQNVLTVVPSASDADTISSGDMIGIYADGGKVVNEGLINVAHDLGYATTGSVFGIYATGSGTIVENKGVISVDNRSPEAKNVIGIYAGAGVTVQNTGTIRLNYNCCSDPAGTDIYGKSYGIYAETGASILNEGEIIIRADKILTENITNPTADFKVEDLDNAWFVAVNQNPIDVLDNFHTSTSSLNNIGAAELLLGSKGIYDFGDTAYAGNIGVDSSLVGYGFDTVYKNEGGIIASDISQLSLYSKSALFDAKLVSTSDTTHDVVMTMKGFDTATDNKSLSDFLTHNYAMGNNEAFFNQLKGFGDVGSLTAGLNSLTGQDMLSRFNFEDMTMMRELNFDMNDKLFHNKEQSFSLAGSVSPMAFKGDTGSNARYSLFNKRQGKFSLGLGVAFTDLRSDDDHNDNARSETMYQLVVPMGYKTHGFNLVTSPRLGYARGSYDRTGLEGKSYDGTIEKRVFGLMNEARYPMMFGDWSVEPSAEFNVIGYQQKGSEDAKEYSLNIKNQNTYSVEGGFGLYLNKVKELAKDKTLKLNLGASVYHEFADPYQLEVGLTGMDGSFMLQDEERSDNRAVIRAGFDYAEEDYSIYGSFISYVDREVRTALKSGMKWRF